MSYTGTPAQQATLKGLVPNHAEDVPVILASLNDYYDASGNPLHVADGPDQLTTGKFLTIVFTENVSAGDQFRIQLLFEMTEGDANIDKHRGDIAALNDNGINLALAALRRPLNLAEINFADVVDGATEVVKISKQDWFAARDS